MLSKNIAIRREENTSSISNLTIKKHKALKTPKSSLRQKSRRKAIKRSPTPSRHQTPIRDNSKDTLSNSRPPRSRQLSKNSKNSKNSKKCPSPKKEKESPLRKALIKKIVSYYDTLERSLSRSASRSKHKPNQVFRRTLLTPKKKRKFSRKLGSGTNGSRGGAPGCQHGEQEVYVEQKHCKQKLDKLKYLMGSELQKLKSVRNLSSSLKKSLDKLEGRNVDLKTKSVDSLVNARNSESARKLIDSRNGGGSSGRRTGRISRRRVPLPHKKFRETGKQLEAIDSSLSTSNPKNLFTDVTIEDSTSQNVTMMSSKVPAQAESAAGERAAPTHYKHTRRRSLVVRQEPRTQEALWGRQEVVPSAGINPALRAKPVASVAQKQVLEADVPKRIVFKSAAGAYNEQPGGPVLDFHQRKRSRELSKRLALQHQQTQAKDYVSNTRDDRLAGAGGGVKATTATGKRRSRQIRSYRVISSGSANPIPKSIERIPEVEETVKELKEIPEQPQNNPIKISEEKEEAKENKKAVSNHQTAPVQKKQDSLGKTQIPRQEAKEQSVSQTKDIQQELNRTKNYEGAVSCKNEPSAPSMVNTKCDYSSKAGSSRGLVYKVYLVEGESLLEANIQVQADLGSSSARQGSSRAEKVPLRIVEGDRITVFVRQRRIEEITQNSNKGNYYKTEMRFEGECVHPEPQDEDCDFILREEATGRRHRIIVKRRPILKKRPPLSSRSVRKPPRKEQTQADLKEATVNHHMQDQKVVITEKKMAHQGLPAHPVSQINTLQLPKGAIPAAKGLGNVRDSISNCRVSSSLEQSDLAFCSGREVKEARLELDLSFLPDSDSLRLKKGVLVDYSGGSEKRIEPVFLLPDLDCEKYLEQESATRDDGGGERATEDPLKRLFEIEKNRLGHPQFNSISFNKKLSAASSDHSKTEIGSDKVAILQNGKIRIFGIDVEERLNFEFLADCRILCLTLYPLDGVDEASMVSNQLKSDLFNSRVLTKNNHQLYLLDSEQVVFNLNKDNNACWLEKGTNPSLLQGLRATLTYSQNGREETLLGKLSVITGHQSAQMMQENQFNQLQMVVESLGNQKINISLQGPGTKNQAKNGTSHIPHHPRSPISMLGDQPTPMQSIDQKIDLFNKIDLTLPTINLLTKLRQGCPSSRQRPITNKKMVPQESPKAQKKAKKVKAMKADKSTNTATNPLKGIKLGALKLNLIDEQGNSVEISLAHNTERPQTQKKTTKKESLYDSMQRKVEALDSIIRESELEDTLRHNDLSFQGQAEATGTEELFETTMFEYKMMRTESRPDLNFTDVSHFGLGGRRSSVDPQYRNRTLDVVRVVGEEDDHN